MNLQLIRKILLGFLLLVAAVALILHLLHSFYLPSPVREPTNSIPIVSHIDWWPYQDELQIAELKVEILDSRLNLFNSKTLISISLKGTMKNDSGSSRPFIKAAQISERFDTTSSGDILVTPIIDVKEDKAYTGQAVGFSLVIEHTLHSFSWGENHYSIRAGQFQQSLVLHQRK